MNLLVECIGDTDLSAWAKSNAINEVLQSRQVLLYLGLGILASIWEELLIEVNGFLKKFQSFHLDLIVSASLF